MSWRVALTFGAPTLATAAAAGVAELATGRLQLALAAWAAGAVLVAAVVSACAEWGVGRAGGESLVLAYWVGVGVRGTLSLAGAGLVAAVAVNPDHQQAYWLWVLAAYVAALTVETVRQVRAADREAARLSAEGSAGTGPIETEGTQ